MIYPLLPVFLSSVLGAGALALGVVEGFAETTAAVLKIVSGWWTDRLQKRKVFVVAGYGLAGAARPLIGLAGSWVTVLALRMTDRVGKGIRTSPRDALIGDSVTADMRGAAFGFHRAMDHAGAVAGPLVAAALLSWFGFSLRAVFLLAAIPALLVMVVLVLWVHDRPHHTKQVADAAPAVTRQKLGRDFRLLLAAVLLFTLGNSTDAFILLRLNDGGVGASAIALLWAVHHVVKMVSAYFGGAFSDRVGRRPVMLAGWIVYAGIYAAFAWFDSEAALIAVFLVYGLYFGLVEPVEKAWVTDLAPPARRGAALGYYHGAVGLAALPASVLFGLIWQQWGAPTAFLFGAAMALAASGILSFVREGTEKT
ncbi:MAG: MFS transporter [Candidatus Hydrogenedentes bacterium]|nr:MFS transporter [Candidatus Hydrogenedentota bacterium]